MCNASNHPLGCNCGFGESGGIKFRFGAQRAFQFDSVARIPHFCVITHTPNARCPVCKEPVFFYKNEYGSAVFFDELGPPWPKHPCTDGGNFVPYTIQQSKTKLSTAESQGWFAVELINASRLKEKVYEFQCKLSKEYLISLFTSAESVENRANIQALSDEAICYIKKEKGEFYSISLLSDDLKVLSTYAYLSPDSVQDSKT